MKNKPKHWIYGTAKTLLTAAFISASGLSSVSLADDTDIYLNPVSPPPGSEPRVMLSLDYRPNLASTMCTMGSTCSFSPEINSALSYFGVSAGQEVTRFDVLRAALKVVLDPLNGVQVGFMMSHNNENNCAGPLTGNQKCSNGGYILRGFESLVSGDTNLAKDELYSILKAIPLPQGNLSHPYQGTELFFEFFRYLTGQGIYNGHNGWTDFGSDNTKNLNHSSGNPHLSWDAGIESSTNAGEYISPLEDLATDACPKLFTVNFLFNVANQDADSEAAVEAAKTAGGVGVNLQNINAAGEFAHMIKILHDTDLADGTWGDIPEIDGAQNVVSYFVVDPSKINTKTSTYAQSGGSGDRPLSLSDDPDELVRTLNDVFSRILSVSTTFVSSSVPVNVFNRTQYLDSVFLAIFQADQDMKPAWTGNLKKLKLYEDPTTKQVTIVDSLGNPAIDGTTGRIAYSALTFWTDPNGYDVLSANTDDGEIVGRDGRSVNRGGGGQRIPGFLSGSPGALNTDTGARRLYAEPDSYTNGTAAQLRAFDADAATAQALWPYLNADGAFSSGTTKNATAWSRDITGAPHTWNSAPTEDQAEAVTVLKHARGLDVDDLDADGSVTDARRWIMGDTLHSKPIAINYGARGGHTTSNPDIRVVLGSNDGFLRMYRNTTSAGAHSGVENWAFMPHAAMPILKRLRDNSASGTPKHPYGIDGEPVVYVYDADTDGTIETGDKVYLYFGMRRGGKAYYALDITDPDNPKMLWKIAKGAAGRDFAQLGLTFSDPALSFMKYDGPTTKPVLIFGGGYDTNKDARNTSPGTDDSEGNAIFIVDAQDGSLVWKATYGATTSLVPNGTPKVFSHSGLVDSIPSRVTAIDTNSDGLTDRLYVGDTGGNVWRADVVSGVDINGDGTFDDNRRNWSLTKLASLGRHANTGKVNDRRFFHAIDVVKSSDGSGAFDAVILGSGDRPNPLDYDIGTSIPLNWLYMIKDRAVLSSATGTPGTTTIAQDDLADLSDNCFQEAGATCSADQQTKLTNGWRVKLEQGQGEKNLSRPITFANTIFYTTYIPPNTATNACAPSEGKGLLYALDLQDASAAFDYNSTNTVTLADGSTEDKQKADRFTGAGQGIPPEVVIIGTNSEGELVLKTPTGTTQLNIASRYRTFWYEKEKE